MSSKKKKDALTRYWRVRTTLEFAKLTLWLLIHILRDTHNVV
jgi:hypothetical protein